MDVYRLIDEIHNDAGIGLKDSGTPETRKLNSAILRNVEDFVAEFIDKKVFELIAETDFPEGAIFDREISEICNEACFQFERELRSHKDY